jgi:hypothetical protein
MYKRLKKNTEWSILNLGEFNIESIKNEVSNFSEEWLLDNSRQKKGYTHADTEMFRICETDYEWVVGQPLITNQRNSLKTKLAQDELDLIHKTLEEYYSGKIIRSEFIKLKANSFIRKHVDGGAMLHYSRRVHIPIITNPLTTFTVMDNTIHMKEGLWYEINNQMPHAVVNATNFDRTHLIVDVMPDDMLYYL